MPKSISVAKDKGANKGEWCEFYTHIKIMSDGFVYKADSNLNIDDSIIYPVLTVFNNQEQSTQFDLAGNPDQIILKDFSGIKIGSFRKVDISLKSKIIFDKILAGSKTFKILEATDLAKLLHFKSLKSTNTKADILLEIDNPYLGIKNK